MIRVVAPILCLALVTGCATGGTTETEDDEIVKFVKETNVSRVLRDSLGAEGAKSIPAPVSVHPGGGAPAWPMRLPARTLRVWVPAHVSPSGNAVLGHWTVIVVEPERFALPGAELAAGDGGAREIHRPFQAADTLPARNNESARIIAPPLPTNPRGGRNK